MLTLAHDVDQKYRVEETCTYAELPPASSSPRRFHLAEDSSASAGEFGGLGTPSSLDSAPSPDATDLRLTNAGTGFKDSTHWTSVLSGVTEAKSQDDTGGAAQTEAVFDDGSSPSDQNVLLFEGCKHATYQELLDSMPPRREADSLVAFYFRVQEYRCRCDAKQLVGHPRTPADT